MAKYANVLAKYPLLGLQTTPARPGRVLRERPGYGVRCGSRVRGAAPPPPRGQVGGRVAPRPIQLSLSAVYGIIFRTPRGVRNNIPYATGAHWRTHAPHWRPLARHWSACVRKWAPTGARWRTHAPHWRAGGGQWGACVRPWAPTSAHWRSLAPHWHTSARLCVAHPWISQKC